MSILELLARPAQSERARAIRRGYPIMFYSGRNGSAKSLCAVYDSIPDLDAGKRVLSTVRILDYTNPRPCDDDECRDLFHGTAGHMAAHPLYVPFTSWPQLLDWKWGPVIMDEITGVADSNEAASMPPVIANKLAQLRRDEVSLRITGLSFIRANKRIREACVAVTRCKSLLGVKVLADDGTERIWRQRRLAIWTTYDAQSLPVGDQTESAYEKADVFTSGRHWIPTSPAIRAYDTFAPVLMVGSVNAAGRCVTCEGNRQALPCSCPDYLAEKAASRPPARKARSAEDSGTDASVSSHSHADHDTLQFMDMTV